MIAGGRDWDKEMLWRRRAGPEVCRAQVRAKLGLSSKKGPAGRT